MNSRTGTEYSIHGTPDADLAKIIKSVLTGAGISILSAIVLMLVVSFIITSAMNDPGAGVNIAAAVIAAVSTGTGGYIASAKNGSRGLICGLLTGFTICIIMLGIMLFMPQNAIEQDTVVLRLIIIICQLVVGCAGGILANNRKSTKKHSNRQKKK